MNQNGDGDSKGLNRFSQDDSAARAWASEHSDEEIGSVAETSQGSEITNQILAGTYNHAFDLHQDLTFNGADEDYCRRLVFRCGRDPVRIERVMRASKLKRDLWNAERDGKTHLAALIARVLKSYHGGFYLSSAGCPLYCLQQLRDIPFHVPEAIVDGVLREGETILIVGRPKVGKSRLLAQLALNLARGEAFLGKPVPKPRRVLLIDLENRPSMIQDRFRRMAGPHDGDKNVFVVAPESLSESDLGLDGAGLERLEKLLDDTQADVLVIDTWRLFLGEADENKAEVVTAGLRKLSTLRATRRQLAIILVHHLRKQSGSTQLSLREDPFTWIESVSGHHALVGHVDACFGLERESYTGEPVIVFGGVARNAFSASMMLEDDADTLLFTPASGVDALLQLLTPKERQFFESAQGLREFGFEQLIRQTGTTNRKTVNSMLKKAVAQGVIRKTSDRYVLVGS